MINVEKYKDELKEIGEYFAISKDGKLSHCSCSLCEKCIFSKGDDCDSNKVKWLLEEYKESIKLSRFEYDILENLRLEWTYLARDEDDNLCVYSYPKPRKLENCWLNLSSRMCLSNLFKKSTFSFIKWADEEPCNIQDILDNCEVEDE